MKKTLYVFVFLLAVWVLLAATSHPAPPPVDPDRDFLNSENIQAEAAASIRAACYDCHSYQTSYPWYAHLPVLSQWIDGHIEQGRADINFSEWSDLPLRDRSELMDALVGVIKREEMPLASYQWMHSEAQWSEAERDFVLASLAAVRQRLLRQVQIPACEWCGAIDAPDSLSWKTVIPPPGEPGEPLLIEGQVFEADGVTPAAGVLIYVYHTNKKGIYPKNGDETGNGKRHGYLRGWMKTDDQGRYQFTTIRPQPYPSRKDPAHIHITLTPPGEEEYWIDSYWFEGDPLITPAMRKRQERPAGKSGIIKVKKDAAGVWRGRRDIVLRK